MIGFFQIFISIIMIILSFFVILAAIILITEINDNFQEEYKKECIYERKKFLLNTTQTGVFCIRSNEINYD